MTLYELSRSGMVGETHWTLSRDQRDELYKLYTNHRKNGLSREAFNSRLMKRSITRAMTEDVNQNMRDTQAYFGHKESQKEHKYSLRQSITNLIRPI